ncbi:sodium/glutamate symporter [Immundisolibacter sp.]|uniref:sodium/glutamate symporter n=1 Tax=Immundisolibacter sp. TaxID=1934948 RepID=UPI00260A76E7|nr:sodium/glutamate symporter [Immundisolibacter sp.]MDD3651121.1 sodium/glutamate symporter [Immundisolibacter sp.]
MLALGLTETLALAALAVAAGQGLRRTLPVLARYDLPAPVLGGLLVALAVSLLRRDGQDVVRFDTTAQTPLMIAFFTTVGFSASLRLLRAGGAQVAWFLAIAALAALAQNLLGAGLAAAMGLPPLLGVLAGSVTLTGGPATGIAFAPLFEQAGVGGATVVAVSAAMAGIVMGGLFGGPLAGRIIARRGLRPAGQAAHAATADDPPPVDSGAALLRAVILILLAMWLGGYLSRGFAALGVTLPAYIGAMLAAAVLRNLGDRQPLLHVPVQAVEDVGAVALSLFIAMALMTLKLWQLAALALPLLALLAAQALLLAGLCQLVFRLMGGDFDAAVMAGGFYGFMMGTTANAVANMQTLTDRYGPAPRAFLVVPLVGAFFIDFVNALLITVFLNVLG